MMAITVAEALANQVGKKIAAGFCDSSDTRSAIIPDGRSASADVLMARNMTIALVAVPVRLLSFSSSSMAFIPNGVAAFTRPSMLAEIFRSIALIAGQLDGTVGKGDRMAGPREGLRRGQSLQTTR